MFDHILNDELRARFEEIRLNVIKGNVTSDDVWFLLECVSNYTKSMVEYSEIIDKLVTE